MAMPFRHCESVLVKVFWLPICFLTFLFLIFQKIIAYIHIFVKKSVASFYSPVLVFLLQIWYDIAMSYKYEMHCHTGCVSRCGRVQPEEIVKLYIEKGYDGIVVTDHYSPMTFPVRHVACPQKEADFYLSGYRRMRAAAPPGFTVLLGMELRHYGTANDYLIYGVEEEFLYRSGNLLALNERRVKRLCEENGYLVYEAHPFRPGRTRINPKYIDGVEVYNGKTKEDQNRQALHWAQRCGKLMISGSDFHSPRELARGGILTERAIYNNADLLTVLKESDFRLIHTPEPDAQKA